MSKELLRNHNEKTRLKEGLYPAKRDDRAASASSDDDRPIVQETKGPKANDFFGANLRCFPTLSNKI